MLSLAKHLVGEILRFAQDDKGSMKKLIALWSLVAIPAFAISPVEMSHAARDYRMKHEREIVGELMELLAIPNLASDTTNIEKNANALVTMLTRRGAEARLLRMEGTPPLVYATLPARNAKITIAFYAHYDGQPVDPKQWTTPPWQPVLRNPSGSAIEPSSHIDPESRLYARSASDDKAPIIAMLTALDALKSVKATPSVNLKFVFEGEEEAGSPHLGAIPNFDDDLKRELALGRTEGAGKSLNELILIPALNLRGFVAGHVEEQASNTISTEARASIDFRLVPAQTPERVRERVERHIAAQNFFIVR